MGGRFVLISSKILVRSLDFEEEETRSKKPDRKGKRSWSLKVTFLNGSVLAYILFLTGEEDTESKP